MNKEQIKAVIKGEGLTAEISDQIGPKGNGLQRTYVYVLKICNGRKTCRSLGRLEVVSAMTEEQLRSAITAQFQEGRASHE